MSIQSKINEIIRNNNANLPINSGNDNPIVCNRTSIPLIENKTSKFTDIVEQIVGKVLNSTTTIESKSTDTGLDSKQKIYKLSIDEKIYQKFTIANETIKLITEFELNYEKQLRIKFQNSLMPLASTLLPAQLTKMERTRLDKLSKILNPLKYRLSEKNFDNNCWLCRQSFQSKNDHNFECSVKEEIDMISAFGTMINLLISLTKMIETFSALTSNDQMCLLQHSVMPIMIMRTLLMINRQPATKPTSAKRRLMLDQQDNNESSITLIKRICLDAIYSGLNLNSPENEIDTKSCDTNVQSTANLMINNNDLKLHLNSNQMAIEYGRKFHIDYQKLSKTIDYCWTNDEYIFYLVCFEYSSFVLIDNKFLFMFLQLFAILLFQMPHSNNIEMKDQIRYGY